MLCPDIWNYPIPENAVEYKGGDLNNNSMKNLKNLVSSHPFNETISIVLPGEYELPGAVTALIKDSDHYKVYKIQLKELLSRQFVEGFVRRGKFTALSCNVCHEIDDCFAVTPDGLLTLSVSKDIYQSLGVEGHPIQNSRRHKDKYIVLVNLLDHSLQPGTKQHDRIQRALSHELLPEISLDFTWDPPDSSICPSSVAKYFTDIGYQVDLCRTKVKYHQEDNLHFPKVNPVKLSNEDSPHELVEAVAMCMLGCDFESELSTYKPSGKTEEIKTACVIHCKGLFSTEFLSKLMKILRSNCEGGNISSWIALAVQGFQNSPLGFSKREHVFSCNGDNDFILFFYRNQKYFLYQNSSTNKSRKK